MSKTTTTISFRCPPNILEQIDAIGCEHFPKVDNSRTNSGCDRSKAIFAIIQAGIAAFTDGEVPVIQSKTDKEKSKTGIDLDEVESLVKKLIKQNSPVPPDEWELTQAIRKEIANSLEEGDIAAELVRNKENLINHLNEVNERLVKVEAAVIGEKKTTPTTEPDSPITELDSPTTEPDSLTTEPDSPITELDSLTTEPDSPITELDTKLSNHEIIKILGISEIIQNKGNKDFKIYIEWLEEQGITQNIISHREAIEKSLGIKIDLKKILGSLEDVLEALGYETHYSKNRAKNMANKVNCEITSYSCFTLPAVG